MKKGVNIDRGVNIKNVNSEVASVKPETTSQRLWKQCSKYDTTILIEKDGAFHEIVTWNDIMKVKPEQRSELFARP